jgi:tetratricopeptide (TPR) repeat protein
VRVAAAAVEREPGSAAAVELHKQVSVAYLLDLAREQSFRDEDDAALATLEQAARIDPDSEQVRDWREKTNQKLAATWRARAFDLHAEDDIDAALEAYEKALKHVPGDPATMEGRNIALALVSHRSGLGRNYFQQGLEALSDLWLDQARSRFSYARKYRPADERTAQRETQVKRLIASEKIAAAKAHEAEKRFGVARHEYASALLQDPDDEEAKLGAERCKVELQVRDLLGRVRMDLVRGRFEQAEATVAKAQELTVLQADEVEGARASIREARHEKAYNEALALERDWRYPEAVARYESLLARADYYKDVIARRDTLKEYIRLAEDLWGRADAATSAQDKLAAYRQIQVFWPEYRDLSARIAALEAALAAGGG